MSENMYFALVLLLTAGVTYLIRLLPLLFVRKRIKNKFLKSFLYYVPCVVLSVMAFPAILLSTEHMVAGIAAAVICALLAYKRQGLIVCMMGSVAAALICEVIYVLI